MDRLKSIPHTIPQLLQEVLGRLEEDHGKNNIATALGLLTCTRNGKYLESF